MHLRVAPHHDRPAARPAGSLPHLLVSDLAMVGLIGAEELIQGLPI